MNIKYLASAIYEDDDVSMASSALGKSFMAPPKEMEGLQNVLSAIQKRTKSKLLFLGNILKVNS